ncbi:unnamed protein product [Schistocephalus solidus]|uniref:Uncharacterized protein n=1 Tax=Schistocephalus solidus TaxID=70667 RepID=A0A3P7E7G2_SCHSO|nr:unnamed protein product [Schistocephalus solidus]
MLLPLSSFLGSSDPSDMSGLQTRCTAAFEPFVADWNGDCDEETRKLIPGAFRQVLRTANPDMKAVFISALQSCDGLLQS